MTKEQAILEVKVIRDFINIYTNAGIEVTENAWLRATELMNEFEIKLEDIR